MPINKPKRRKKRRSVDEYVHYFVAVYAWDHYYGFSAHGRSRHEDAGYRRTETLTFKGKMALPEGFRYPNVEVTLSADNTITANTREGLRSVIGTLYAAGDRLYVHALIPGEHMPQLVAVAASERVRVASFIGSPLKRRGGTISNISVTTASEDLSDGNES